MRRKGGSTPLTVRAQDRRSLDAALVTQLVDAHDELGVQWGDMAVLTQTRGAAEDYEDYRRVLRAGGVPFVDLLDYDGISSDRVKVGTFKRAKGLEFAYVLLPGLTEGPVARWPGESDETYRERAERLHRELFVAMTWARDGL